MSTDIVSRITAWLQLHERAVASNDQGEIRYAEHICPMELVKARDEIVRLTAENERLTKVALFLFQRLDDIDTVSDMAKGDLFAYRREVERLHRRRFEVGTTDGYTVTFPVQAALEAQS